MPTGPECCTWLAIRSTDALSPRARCCSRSSSARHRGSPRRRAPHEGRHMCCTDSPAVCSGTVEMQRCEKTKACRAPAHSSHPGSHRQYDRVTEWETRRSVRYNIQCNTPSGIITSMYLTSVFPRTVRLLLNGGSPMPCRGLHNRAGCKHRCGQGA